MLLHLPTRFVTCSVLVLLLSSASLPGAGQPATDELVEFTSRKGKFSILLPGKPVEEVVEVGKAQEKQHQFKIGAAQGAYVVSYQDNPNLAGATAEKLQAALETGRDALVPLFQGKLTESKSTSLDKKHPGLSFRVTIPQAQGEANCRFYMVGTRLYQIMVVGLPEFTTAPQATQVIESFKLLP